MTKELIGWPDPVEALRENGASDVVLLCEHASSHIPLEYEELGLSEHDLQRHIAWDPGAASVARQLSARLDATAFLGTYSRLLIDLNRPLDAPSSIVTLSEETQIPGNIDIPIEERQRRAGRIFLPFHRRVSQHLDERLRRGRATRLVTIHSFTPVFLGVVRPWHAGVLFDRAEDFGGRVIELLRVAGLIVEANVPYKTDRAEDYAIPIHGDDRGIPAVLVEIRNDLIGDDVGPAIWAKRLADVREVTAE
jgi:predicted N-formylglutamate amidohydrolase